MRGRTALHRGAAAEFCEEHKEERRLSAHEPDHPAPGARAGLQTAEVRRRILQCQDFVIELMNEKSNYFSFLFAVSKKEPVSRFAVSGSGGFGQEQH